MELRRSILAVSSALGAALAVQLILLAVLNLAAPALAGTTGRVQTLVIITAYGLGVVPTAIAAGVALGRLAPTMPSLHVAILALVSPLLGYLLSGASALPHGWQLVGYGAQLMLIEAVTLVVFRAQRRPPTSFATPAA